MHDHWHFVVKPKKEGDLHFFGYLTLTHAARRQSAHKSIGEGHVYQGRFKSFMIQEGDSLKQVLRLLLRKPHAQQNRRQTRSLEMEKPPRPPQWPQGTAIPPRRLPNPPSP